MTEIYFAGSTYKKNDFFMQGIGFNRLMSYVNQDGKQGWLNQGRNMMDIYMAGGGVTKPQNMILQLLGVNRLLSYTSPLKDTWVEFVEEIMNLYMAGFRGEKTTEEIFKRHKDFLVAFKQGSDKSLKILKQVNSKSKFFIDSGAFSSWTKKKEVDIDAYIDWLNDNDDMITIFAQLDCIPGTPGKIPTKDEREEAANKTLENYLYMIEKVKSPEKCLFTFHLSEDYKHLEKFLNMDFSKYLKDFKPEYMALGGMVGSSEIEKEKFIAKCFEIIEKSKIPNIKVHLFGVTQLSILEKFPKVTSADSTGWIMTAAMGNIYYDTGTLLISDWQFGDKNHVSHYITPEMKQKIERFGFTLEQLQKDPGLRCIYNACFLDEQVKNIKYKPLMKMNKLF